MEIDVDVVVESAVPEETGAGAGGGFRGGLVLDEEGERSESEGFMD
jgi:hypothetical protein